MTEPRPRIAVLVFPGSNDDRDAALALEGARRRARARLARGAASCRDVGAVVLPGGFSYGDYLRARRDRALLAGDASASPTSPRTAGSCSASATASRSSARPGCCPGRLRPNESLSFVCRDVPLRVERADAPFLTRCEVGQRLTIPVKHGEGCFFADAELARRARRAGRSSSATTPTTRTARSTTSPASSTRDGNVMGLMPHPEHAVDPLLGSADGALILEGSSIARASACSRRRSPKGVHRCGLWAPLGSLLHAEPERLGELRAAGQALDQLLDVTRAQRDRAAPSGSVGRVGEADEALALRPLEQLDDRREPLVAGALRNASPLRRGSPGPRVSPSSLPYEAT